MAAIAHGDGNPHAQEWTRVFSAGASANSEPSEPHEHLMSKRNTYLLGGAAIAVGIVLIVIALTSLSDDGGSGSSSDGGSASSSPGAGQPASREEAETGGGSGARKRANSLSRAIARRRPVPAPGFAVEVIDEGSAPALVPKLSEATAGGSLALAKLRGTPVVLHIWSSACGPCRSDARLIETTWQRWGRRGVAFIGLSVDESESAAARFAREYGLSYPIVRDPGGRVANAFGATTLPATFFISSGGDIIGSVAGSPSVGQMEQGTAGARMGRPVGSLQGGSREPRP